MRTGLISRYRTFEPMSAQREHTIAILGLGYVGLPLAVAFSKKYKTLGFDINAEKAALIASGVDPTNELDVTNYPTPSNRTFKSLQTPPFSLRATLLLLLYLQTFIPINPQTLNRSSLRVP